MMFGPAFAMGIDARAHLLRQHLCAQADAEEGRIFLQAGADPVDLGLDERAGKSLRLPVQWVNRPNLDFRGFSGQIASGSVPREIVRMP